MIIDLKADEPPWLIPLIVTTLTTLVLIFLVNYINWDLLINLWGK